MSFFKRLPIAATTLGMLMLLTLSCEQEISTIGDGVVGSEPFETDTEVFDVFAYNRKINAVQTNKLPIYQLGHFNDPVYGRTEAQITTQVRLANGLGGINFGRYTSAVEDGADTDESALTIQEEEEVTAVYLYIPFLSRSNADTDGDGLADLYDSDPEDATSDTDGDGLTDNDERIRGTNPLSVDTDGDGINDDVDESTTPNIYPKKITVDSIYGNRDTPFTLKVQRSTYFLRDLDPATNFINSQEYYSNQEFTPSFVSDVLFEGPVSVTDTEVIFFKEDDPDTEDVDESLEVDQRISPGIRVPLNTAFFQENFIDKEGSDELLSQTAFADFIRGIHLSLPNSTDDFMALLDLTRGNIRIEYDYLVADLQDTADDTSDDTTVVQSSSYVLSLIAGGGTNAIVGNAVNTFIMEEYSPEIATALDSDENASKLYIKGGAGLYTEIKLFDEINGSETINEIKANNWIINEANLVFHVDRTTIDNAGESIDPPRLYLFNAETSQPLYNSLTDISAGNSALGVFLDYDGLVVKENDLGVTYTFRITDHINNLVVRDSVNATLGLSVSSDIRAAIARTAVLNGEERKLPVMAATTPLGTILHGSNVSTMNEDKKLQLKISYTKTN